MIKLSRISTASGISKFTLAPRAALLAASGLSLLLMGQAAQAQTAVAQDPAAQAAGDDSDNGLGDIVVTAQKRSENVQDVPIAITALGSDALENRQVNGIDDLVKIVPSMFVAQNYGANTVSLRGISTGTTSGAEDPSVAVHVNGVYQPRSRSINLAAMDLDRVEVLAGPQGTLYGRNATGGVINYITKGPTSTFEAGATFSAGNYERFGVEGYVSGPLSDSVGIRISGQWQDQGKGFIKNLLPGAPNSTFGDGNTLAGHVVLSIKASDSVRFDLDGIYGRTNSAIIFEAFGPTQFGPGVAAILGRQSFKPHEVYSPYPSKFDNKYFQTSLTSTFDISNAVQLKSITAYQGYQDQMNIDNSASEFLAVAVDQSNRSRMFTQEFNLTTHLLDDKLTSVYGFFYFNEKIDVTAGVPFVIAGQGNYYTYVSNQDSESYAFFTDQTLHLSDSLRLIGGLRYNHDSKTMHNKLTAHNWTVVNGSYLPQPAYFTACDVTNKNDWSAWTPKVGVQFDASKNVMVYGGWQKGFKAGGFTANTCGDDYDPESIQGPEFGIKSELLDGHLRLNFAAYYYKYKNLQVQKVVGVGQFSVENAASATLKGVEVSAAAKLSDNFKIDLAANLQEAKYDEFFNCNNTDITGPCSANPPVQADLSGHWLNRAPPYTINLGAEYNVDVGGGNLRLRAESFWSGKVRFDPYQTLAGMNQDAYSVQNLFLTFTPAGEKFHVRAYVKNVFDESYKSSAFYNSADGEPTGNWAAPRTFGIEAGFKF